MMPPAEFRRKRAFNSYGNTVHFGMNVYSRHQTSRPSPIPRDLVNRARNILTALVAAADMQGVQVLPAGGFIVSSGDREGTWSVSVSGNWRITFNLEGGDITNLDLEDYH